MGATLPKLVTAFAALPIAQAVLVTPDSPCDVKCGNVLDATAQTDIACSDTGFGGGDSQIFKGCVQCETNSRFVGSNNQTDVAASLYNMRYTVSSCLFGVPSKDQMLPSNPCIINKACEYFKNATIYDKLSSQDHGYEYCDDWPVSDDIDFKGCKECLAVDHLVLSNFVTMLHAGCKQRPVPGVTIGVDGDPFGYRPLNITAPSPIATVDPAWFDQGPLNLNAKVGIAVGSFVFILIILGVFVVWNGKRRRRAYLKKLEAIYTTNKGWPAPQSPGGMFETPVSQRPLINGGWGDSPLHEQPDKPFPRYVSPYASQYNSPTSATDMTSMPWPDAALPRDHNIGLTVPDNHGHSWDDNKGKGHAESYELHDVDSNGSNVYNPRHFAEAPMLGHPGYGRNSASPTKHYLTEEDLRTGHAI